MCILFFALKQHPIYPVIICANRDEFHQRPTLAMFPWKTPKIIAGKDLQAGGTWLGFNALGYFSALTNYRQGPATVSDNQGKKSRGELVLNSLNALAFPQHNALSTAETSDDKSDENNNENNNENSDKKSDETFFTSLATNSKNYPGFNLIYGSLNDLHCFDSINQEYHSLSPGFHSICNGALDDIWPKMASGQQALTRTITGNTGNREVLTEQLFKLMTDPQQAETDKLPDTGMPLAIEQMLSAVFIVSPEYGTRSTTIITQDVHGEVLITDRNYNQRGEKTNQQTFNLAETFSS